MSSRIQLLIHEGELNQILRVVSKSRENKVIGSLYGLWRNSLRQPVVQLTTGPGKGAKIGSQRFECDHGYHEKCNSYFKENHGLLHIGLWVSGSSDRYPKLDPLHNEFQVNYRLMPTTGKYCVLMFVNAGANTNSFEFIIVDRIQPKQSRRDRLYQEDILPGDSCFRLIEQISATVKEGAMFQPKNKPKPYDITRHDLPRLTDACRPVAVEQVDSHAPETQWYETDDGGNLLAMLLGAFERNAVSVDISRNANSHELTFELNGKLFLNFPREFPEKQPSLSWTNDSRGRQTGNHPEICRRLVSRVVRILRVF